MPVQGRICVHYINIITLGALPCAYPSPKRSGVPCTHVEIDISARDANINIFHVNKCIELNLPIVARVAPIATVEPYRPQDCLVVYFVLLVGSEAVVQQLYIGSFVVKVPGKRFLTKQDELSAIGDF